MCVLVECSRVARVCVRCVYVVCVLCVCLCVRESVYVYTNPNSETTRDIAQLLLRALLLIHNPFAQPRQQLQRLQQQRTTFYEPLRAISQQQHKQQQRQQTHATAAAQQHAVGRVGGGVVRSGGGVVAAKQLYHAIQHVHDPVCFLALSVLVVRRCVCVYVCVCV